MELFSADNPVDELVRQLNKNVSKIISKTSRRNWRNKDPNQKVICAKTRQAIQKLHGMNHLFATYVQCLTDQMESQAKFNKHIKVLSALREAKRRDGSESQLMISRIFISNHTCAIYYGKHPCRRVPHRRVVDYEERAVHQHGGLVGVSRADLLLLLQGGQKKILGKLWRRNLESYFISLESSYQWAPRVQKGYKKSANQRLENLKELIRMKLDWNEITSIQGKNRPDVEKLVNKSVLQETDILRRHQLNRPLSFKNRSSYGRSVVISSVVKVYSSIVSRESSLQNLSEVFSHKKLDLDKETADALYLFTLFCDLVQKHLKDNTNAFFKMKDVFIDYISSINRDTDKLIKNLKQFIRLMWETLVDYYRVDQLDQLSGPNSFFTEENMQILVTSVMFRNSIVHAMLFQSFSYSNSAKEKEVQEALERLKDITPQSLHIKPQYCLNTTTIKWFMSKNQQHDFMPPKESQSFAQPYLICVQKLRQIQETRTPAGKLKILVSTADLIISSINLFYQTRNMKVSLQTLDADQVLSIFCLVIIKCKVKNFYSHLDIIEMFSGEGQLRSETGYYFSVVCTALQSLLSVQL